MNNVEQIIGEVRRKSPRKNNRQVSSEKKYEDDLEKHNYSETVVEETKTVTQLFKERKDAYLKSNHDAHELE